jgi:serine/threonine protein kinase
MLQLVDAVEYIHSKGIYHRDIKPENIFLSSSGAMKLGDFGLVTREEWSYETTVGSDRYMAPEQYDSAGAGYSPAQADIWAIGICLLNILFSRNPFTTPTESDPLYLDFVRDRQSLFDVFPTMSQDTYEVIVQCMSLDPRKRSLDGARDALLRVVSFTTFDESLDDFCTIPKTTTVSANREPLRTPSIQSPQMDQGSFPWAKALHASPPQQFRQLSAIPDTEIYDEELFPSSEDSISQDWFSVKNTPSLASVLESNLGESMKSLMIQRPIRPSGPPRAEKSVVSGSLPINMSKSKPMPMPSMSSVFGRKRDAVSKSWSDMWEEDIEEEEELAHELELKQRQEQNARTWSHDSKNEVTVGRVGLSEPKNLSFLNVKSLANKTNVTVFKDIDNDPNDGFFFQDSNMTRQYSPPRYSPPSKRSTFDKWAALGDRRRAVKSPSSEKSSDVLGSRKDTANGKGLGFFGFGMGGFWDKDDKVNGKVKDWGKARDQCRQRTHDFGDLEWVGGLRHDTENLL